MAQTELGSACHTEATGIGAGKGKGKCKGKVKGKGKGKGNVADEQLRLTGYLSFRGVQRDGGRSW